MKWSVESVEEKQTVMTLCEQSLSEMLKVEKYFTADSERSLV